MFGQRVTASSSGLISSVWQAGQRVGRTIGVSAASAPVHHRFNHFGYHIAGPLDQDRITDAQVLAVYLVLIVQGGSAHGGAVEV